MLSGQLLGVSLRHSGPLHITLMCMANMLRANSFEIPRGTGIEIKSRPVAFIKKQNAIGGSRIKFLHLSMTLIL